MSDIPEDTKGDALKIIKESGRHFDTTAQWMQQIAAWGMEPEEIEFPEPEPPERSGTIIITHGVLRGSELKDHDSGASIYLVENTDKEIIGTIVFKDGQPSFKENEEHAEFGLDIAEMIPILDKMIELHQDYWNQ